MQIVSANSRISERAVESTGEREAEILTTDYRMNADLGLEPRLISAVEWENVRLCSLMFAYVRLIGKKTLRALRASTMRNGGKRAGFKFLTVRHLISHCRGIGYGNPAVRIQVLCGRQSNGVREGDRPPNCGRCAGPLGAGRNEEGRMQNAE